MSPVSTTATPVIDRELVTLALVQSGILRVLDFNTAAKLCARLHQIRLAPGDLLFAQGDGGEHLYFVISGRVKVTWHRGGQENVLTLMGPSEMLGEMSVFDFGRRQFTVTALTEVHAVMVRRAQILEWVTEHPEIALQMLRLIARRTELMTTCLIDRVTCDVECRIANRLLQLAKRFGQRDSHGLRVTHYLTGHEFAHFVDADSETAEVVLDGFATRGWIQIDGNSIVIIDAETLNPATRCGHTT